MDIEHLSKSQIVLLTLFTSFVTSIATGIVAVALMQQAPTSVAATVNHIIRETVKEVSQPAAAAAAAVKSYPAPAPAQSDTSIAHAVARAQSSIVRLYASGGSFVGLAVEISPGVFASDLAEVGSGSGIMTEDANGSTTPFSIIARNAQAGLAYLAQDASTTPLALQPIRIGGSGAILGDEVIMLGGQSTTHVDDGIMTALPSAGETGTVPVIETNILPDQIVPGSILIDRTGALVGISTSISRAVSSASFTPASLLDSTLKEASH